MRYNPKIYARFHMIGGGGGKEFQWVQGTSGTLIQKLEVWAGEWQLRGIKVTLTNGEVKMFGNAAEKHAGVLEFDPGERVTELSIWGNGNGTRCGAFKIKTSKKKVFFPKMYKWGLKTEYKMEIGSGLLCGIYGHAGSDIDCLGFAFLRPVTDSILKKVTYPTLSTDLVSTTPFMIDRIDINNLKGTVPQTTSLKGSESFTVSHEWTSTTRLELSITSSVKAGIPEVAEASEETKLTISEEFSFSRSESKTVDRGIDFPVTCPAHQHMRASATTYQDQLDLPYNAKFEVTLDSGSKFSYDVHGIYKGASVREVFINYDLIEAAEESGGSRSFALS